MYHTRTVEERERNVWLAFPMDVCFMFVFEGGARVGEAEAAEVGERSEKRTCAWGD